MVTPIAVSTPQSAERGGSALGGDAVAPHVANESVNSVFPPSPVKKNLNFMEKQHFSKKFGPNAWAQGPPQFGKAKSCVNSCFPTQDVSATTYGWASAQTPAPLEGGGPY